MNNEALIIKEFHNWDLQRKLEIFDGGCVNLEKLPSTELFAFLKEIVLQQNENDYIRKRALHNIFNLAFIDKTIERKTINLILDDISSQSDLFIQLECLKNLYLFFEKEPSEIENYYLNFITDEAELQSECFYSLGIINFFKAIIANNQKEFSIIINHSRAYFSQSRNLIENRIDAIFFTTVCDIISVVKYSPFILKDHIKTIKESLWERNIFSSKNNLFEYKIYLLIINLAQINKEDPNLWIDYINQFTCLCVSFLQIKNLELKDKFLDSKLIASLAENIIRDNVLPFLTVSFSNQRIKIEECLKLESITKEEKDFLEYLYSLVSDKNSIKKETSDLLEKLKKTYQEITEELLIFLSSKTESQEELISEVLQYIENKNLKFSDVLSKIISACIKLQGNSLYNKQPEDFRNTYIRDLLDASGLYLKDQSFWGKSQSGTNPGEVDIVVLNTKKTPFCIIEVLNLDSLKQKYLEDHIQKLYGYDPNGLKNNIILVYSEVVNFSDFWIKYKAHVTSYNWGLEFVNSEELDSGFGNIKLLKIEYRRYDFHTNLYHLVIHLNN
ncbi:hypothetical protein [Dysgonomonas sp. ZJ709]|uniref:hypothetical protein n=1 Tax=Dysgonomonas sp. ZJ709 TaxID=2709797 RepID=UPI0013EDB3AB|nr:hypothetical protein [Dysgonomonas sp. ZJ709]